MAAVLFADGDPLEVATAARSDPARRRRVEMELLRRGIFVNLPAKFYLCIEHDEAQVDATVAAFQEALAVAARP
jgi:glutamate-1-semialdehyde aminotransferase